MTTVAAPGHHLRVSAWPPVGRSVAVTRRPAPARSPAFDSACEHTSLVLLGGPATTLIV